MKKINSFNLIKAASLATILVSSSAQAAIVVNEVNDAQFTYSPDVSNTDLLDGLTATALSGWNNSSGASDVELTDGVHGLGFRVDPADAIQGAWTTVGATATYNLGAGANGLGFDITSVVSIADWEGAGFGNQAWTMEVRTIGGTFTTLASVDYQPLNSDVFAGTKVTLTDSTGTIATGIDQIRITANEVNAGANNGAFVWRELDVIGTDTAVVPEPTSTALLGLGGLALLLRRRK